MAEPPIAPPTTGTPAGQPFANRPRVNGWVVALIVVLAIIAATVIRARLHSASPSAQPVELRWSGTARTVTISVTTPAGTTTYAGRSNNSQMQMPAGIVEVGVMDEADDHGSVSCELVSGGASLSYNHADGEFAIATCSN